MDGPDDLIYLDHAATTPLRPEALAAMLPHLSEGWGNPSSNYEPGRRARVALEDARARVADRLHAAAAGDNTGHGGVPRGAR